MGKGLWPIAVCKDDRDAPFVTMALNNLLDLARESWTQRKQIRPAVISDRTSTLLTGACARCSSGRSTGPPFADS